MMKIAFVLLCAAQMIHFSKHIFLLTQKMIDDAREQRLQTARVRATVAWK